MGDRVWIFFFEGGVQIWSGDGGSGPSPGVDAAVRPAPAHIRQINAERRPPASGGFDPHNTGPEAITSYTDLHARTSLGLHTSLLKSLPLSPWRFMQITERKKEEAPSGSCRIRPLFASYCRACELSVANQRRPVIGPS